jgi:flavin reductase
VPDHHDSPEVDAFRRAAGQFVTGITVVTTVSQGVDHAMTASSFTSVSLEPLLVLVCADRDTRFHDAVLESGLWAVSVLDSSARDAAVWFAKKGRPLERQLDHAPYHRGPITGAALLDAGLAWMECETYGVHDGGDHTIVVGRVLGVAVAPDAPDPLVYHRSAYVELGRPSPTMGGLQASERG